ncbi:hypothetical protein ACWEPC_07160, partial [Nonomuraea sp. NPDC004297]
MTCSGCDGSCSPVSGSSDVGGGALGVPSCDGSTEPDGVGVGSGVGRAVGVRLGVGTGLGDGP